MGLTSSGPAWAPCKSKYPKDSTDGKQQHPRSSANKEIKHNSAPDNVVSISSRQYDTNKYSENQNDIKYQ